MKSPALRGGIAMVGLLLSACATPPRPAPPIDATSLLVCEPALVRSRACAEAMAALDARAAAASAVTAASAATAPVTATGRAAIRQGRQGGSVDFEWVALGGDDFSLTLTAPLGAGRWQVTQKSGKATLTGTKGGPRSGADATALVKAATGFDLPVRQMGAWLGGVPAANEPPGRLVFAGHTRLVELQQSGWTLRFDRFDDTGRPLLIEATRADASVRLLISQWSGGIQ